MRGQHVVDSSPLAMVRRVEDQGGLRHGVLPVLLAGAVTLVHHAHHGLVQRAHVALGRVLPQLLNDSPLGTINLL
eukprot:2837977-Pleurochrysis_carterae.AAC.1